MVPLRGVHVRQATPPLPDNSVVTDLDFDAFDALTFDCYGTLIDWEAGITVGLRRILDRHAVDATDDQLLEAFAAAESRLEARPYLPYRTILAAAARAVGQGLGIEVDDDEASEFGGSVGDWPAFEDSARSLKILRRRFKLGVLTNCDDDLFAASNRRLGVDFDWVVTAQQVGSYKPNPHNFETLRERLHGSGIAAARREHFENTSVVRLKPPCCPEPVSRPRPGQTAGLPHGLDRSPSRSARFGRDAAGRRPARCHLPLDGRVRGGRGARLSPGAESSPPVEPPSAPVEPPRPRLSGAVFARSCRGRRQDRHTAHDFGGSLAHPSRFRA